MLSQLAVAGMTSRLRHTPQGKRFASLTSFSPLSQNSVPPEGGAFADVLLTHCGEARDLFEAVRVRCWSPHILFSGIFAYILPAPAYPVL
jgi:hypothetical protein